MSIEYEAIIAIAVHEKDVNWTTLLTDEQNEELIDDWLIDSDSWCGGEHFFGKVIVSTDGGQYLDISDIFSDELIDNQKYIQTGLAKCGLSVPLDKIKLYLIHQRY